LFRAIPKTVFPQLVKSCKLWADRQVPRSYRAYLALDLLVVRRVEPLRSA
jgi:hypothetical protein